MRTFTCVVLVVLVVVVLLLHLSLQHALIQRNVYVHSEHVSECVSVSLTLALHDTLHHIRILALTNTSL